MGMLALSALRVEHTSLTKQLQGVFIAHHDSSGESLTKFSESLVVHDDKKESSEEKFLEDRKRLLADMGGNTF